MTLSRREALAAGAAALPVSALFQISASGQAPPPGTPGSRNPGARDPLLACCLLIDGRKETEICKFAQNKLQNDDCKTFCKNAIDEFESLRDRLKEYGFEYPVPPPGTGTTTRPADTGIAPIPQLAVGRVLLPPGATEEVAIARDVAEQCVADFKDMAQKKQGTKFDQCFVGCQLAANAHLASACKAFKRHASPDMQAVLSDKQKVFEQNISKLEDLMAKLDRQGENRGTERKGS